MFWFSRPYRYRYRVEAAGLTFMIVIWARDLHEATRHAAEIGSRHHMLLVGPL